MKMKSKIIAALCTLTLAFSSLSTFMVAEAVNVPNVQYIWNFVDTGNELDDSVDEDLEYEDIYGAKLYEITLTVKGGAKKASVKENGTTVAYTGAWISGIEGVAARYTTTQDIVIIKSTKNWTVGTAVAGQDVAKNKLAYSWGAAESSECIKADDVLLATWTVFAADGADITDLTISAHEDAAPNTKFDSVWDGTDKTGVNNVFAPSSTIVGYPAAPAAEVTGITIDPATATVNGGETKDFTAEVTGTGDFDATYTLTASAGTITDNKTFTAPAATEVEQTITITATANGNSEVKATATVTVPAKVADPKFEATATKSETEKYYTGKVGDVKTVQVFDVKVKDSYLKTNNWIFTFSSVEANKSRTFEPDMSAYGDADVDFQAWIVGAPADVELTIE